MAAHEVARWLRSLGKTEVKPCRVTFTHKGKGEDKVRGPLDGASYKNTVSDATTIYLVGEVPRWLPIRHVCYPYQGQEWFVSCYMDAKNFRTLDTSKQQYHPFGLSFQVSPWTLPEAIDHWETKPYARISMEVQYLEPDVQDAVTSGAYSLEQGYQQ